MTGSLLPKSRLRSPSFADRFEVALGPPAKAEPHQRSALGSAIARYFTFCAILR